MFPVRNVGMIYSSQFEKMVSTHPKYLNRFEIIINLIKSFNLFNYLNIVSVNLDKNQYLNFLENLTSFHSYDYLTAVSRLSNLYEDEDEIDYDSNDFEEYGLVYDCCGFKGLFEFSLNSVAGTISAAQSLISGKNKICINWSGGWHHAKKYEASGFCYMNDIVYGIMTLMNHFHRVLYVDIDLHHGDGVEEAFLYTPRVLTLSIHYSAPGFFPSSSDTSYNTGLGKGKHSAAQFSFLQEGISDEVYCNVFDRIMKEVLPVYKPDVIVVQCGADSLCTDPFKVFNVTHKTYEHVLGQLLEVNVHMLVLGGGGYNFPDTAKVWTRVTALLLGLSLSEDIPEHDQYPLYGPYFESVILPSNRLITLDDHSINKEIIKIKDQMKAFNELNGDFV